MLPPLNVEQITRQAGEYQYDPLIPLRYWLRSSGLLVKEVSSLFPGYIYFPLLTLSIVTL
jgi:hypothetical protein